MGKKKKAFLDDPEFFSYVCIQCLNFKMQIEVLSYYIIFSYFFIVTLTIKNISQCNILITR